MGNIPVLVRLVLEDGTETWRIAAANRWTREQVLVIWRNDPDNPYSTQSCWLAAHDVARAITGPTEQLASLWGQLPRGAPPRPSTASGEGTGLGAEESGCPTQPGRAPRGGHSSG